MRVSMGEIPRIGLDVLRGLGLGYSIAWRGREMIAWSEAVHGCALKYMRLNSAKLVEAHKLGFEILEERTVSIRVNARGQSLLTIGPRAIDLAVACARRGSVGCVKLENVNGLFMSHALLASAAERGHSCVALFASSSKRDPFEATGMTISNLDGKCRRVMAFRSSINGKNTIFSLRDDLFHQNDLNRRVRCFAEETKCTSHNWLEIICFPIGKMLSAPAGVTQQAKCHLCLTGAGLENWVVFEKHDYRFQQAMIKGIDVASEDFKAFWEMSKLIRIPNSQRSQIQAG